MRRIFQLENSLAGSSNLEFRKTAKSASLALALLGSVGTAQAFEKNTTYPGCVARSARELFTDSLTTPRDVSWYGDSRTTSNCYITTSSGLEYSTYGTTFARRSTPSTLTIRQRGRNGTSLQQLQSGADSVALPSNAIWDTNDTQANGAWATQIQNDNSGIIVIAHGTNDAWRDRINSAGTVGQFESRLTTMVAQAQAAGKKVVLVEPYRVCSYAMVDRVSQVMRRNLPADGRLILEHPDTILAPYALAVSRVAMNMGTHLAPLFSVPVKCNGDYANADMPDGLHATPAYDAVLAEVVKSAINRAVTDVRGPDGKPIYPKPTLTLLRAPLQQYTSAQMTFPTDFSAYPNIMPAGGQDYQILVKYPTGANGLPVLQMSNWIASHTTSVSVTCFIEEPFVEGRTVSWSNLLPTFVGDPGAMPAKAGRYNCQWTASGPGGSVVVPETFHILIPWATNSPQVTIARGPMPLVAGKPFQTTWRVENATSLTRQCTSTGTGFVSSTESLPLSSDPDYLTPAKAWNFANLNGVTVASAQSAWVGYPTTCTWTAYGPTGSITMPEVFHTVMP